MPHFCTGNISILIVGQAPLMCILFWVYIFPSLLCCCQVSLLISYYISLFHLFFPTGTNLQYIGWNVQKFTIYFTVQSQCYTMSYLVDNYSYQACMSSPESKSCLLVCPPETFGFLEGQIRYFQRTLFPTRG